MITIAIPARNEASTIGVLLWRIRGVFQEYAREYEVLVYDDGSSDATAEVLKPYEKAMPLTVLGGPEGVGYARAMDALIREAARRTRYPRRDAIILMQGDFTDQPEHIPELVRRFEGGADLILAERTPDPRTPTPERRLRRVAAWYFGSLLKKAAVSDPFGTFRLIRLATVRELIKARGDTPLLSNDAWAGNLELFCALKPLARRIENVPLAARYDLRLRPSRRKPLADAFALLRSGRSVRRSLAGTASA